MLFKLIILFIFFLIVAQLVPFIQTLHSCILMQHLMHNIRSPITAILVSCTKVDPERKGKLHLSSEKNQSTNFICQTNILTNHSQFNWPSQMDITVCFCYMHFVYKKPRSGAGRQLLAFLWQFRKQKFLTCSKIT